MAAEPARTEWCRHQRLTARSTAAWLTDVLERIVSGHTKRHELATLLPWNWAAANANAVEISSTA
jgi:hypothetical protein